MCEIFPDIPLHSGTPIADEFLREGCAAFRAAAYYVHSLPYGRNTSRSDFALVLRERRGTCSSKHALLAQLACETGIELDLVLGIYEMTGDNTPGVAMVLQKYALSAIPEAHCVVRYNGRYADITRTSPNPVPKPIFIHEEIIEPWQVADYKVQIHREFLRTWCERRGLTFDTVWSVREECIAALGE